MLHVTRDVLIYDTSKTSPYPSTTYPLQEVDNTFGPRQDYPNALFDACVKRLATQKGAVRGYPEDYGMDWTELRDMAPQWAQQVLPDRIRACLSVDDRVKIVEVRVVEVDSDYIVLHLGINREPLKEVRI